MTTAMRRTSRPPAQAAHAALAALAPDALQPLPAFSPEFIKGFAPTLSSLLVKETLLSALWRD